jgi:hypothetical protein
MKTFLFGVSLTLVLLVTDAYAQHGGCAHGAAAGAGSTSSVTSTGSTGTGSVVSGGESSAVARQLLQLALQQAQERYLKEQEELAAQEEEERQQYLAERRERLLARKGTTLGAKLAGSHGGATGFVTYHTSKTNGDTVTRLRIEIAGAEPNSTHSVSLGDREVGRITTDSRGAGLLILSTNPRGAVQRALSANFPQRVLAGSNVSVGSLTGTWRQRTTI